MNTDVRLTLGPNGQLVLPASVLAHYGLAPEAALRIIETSSGILLVPEQDGQMSEALAQELREWQSLYDEDAGIFVYEDQDKDSRTA